MAVSHDFKMFINNFSFENIDYKVDELEYVSVFDLYNNSYYDCYRLNGKRYINNQETEILSE